MTPYRSIRRVVAGAAIAALSQVATADDWSLRLPKEDKVIYRGLINPDRAGLGTGFNMMYGPGLVGAFVVLAGHALVVDEQKSRQLRKLQEDADKVLLPYQEMLSTFSYPDLMRKALDGTLTAGGKKLVDFSAKPGAGWFIESSPVFAMPAARRLAPCLELSLAWLAE